MRSLPLRVRGFLLLPLSIVVGSWAALIAEPARDEISMVAGFLACAALLALASGLPASAPAGTPLPPRSRGRALFRIAGCSVAAALVAAALVKFADPTASPANAWRLYCAGLAAMLAPFLVPEPSDSSGEEPTAAWEWLGIGLVMILAAAFRFHDLASRPYGLWFDEAQNMLEALRILHEPGYRPVFVEGFSQMPAMPFYYLSVFASVLGGNVFVARLATTVAALVAILCVWRLGRELFGATAGLLAGALLAVERWHVDFSRFAMASIFVTLFVPLVVLLFLRSQRRLSARDAVLSGVGLGLGFQFYYAMFSVPVLLAATLVHRLVVDRARAVTRIGLAALAGAAAVITYAPVMQYARMHPEGFNQRMRTVSTIRAASLGETVTLFATPSAERDRVVATLTRTTGQHLRMFHIEGDHNGRHNLPGAPMLDPVTGLLFAVGLAWCLVGAPSPRFGLLVLWFGAMILPGILSLDFEAPQGNRTLGLTPVIALMAALPLAGVCGLVAEAGKIGPLLAAALATVVVGDAARRNWQAYFDVQLWDPSAWAVFSTPETKIAEVVHGEGEGADVYVQPQFLGGPSQTLILGHPMLANPFLRGRDLPLEATGRKAILFFDGNDRQTVDSLKRSYPRAHLEPFGAPRADGTAGPPILWIVRIDPASIAELGGWRLEYVAGDGSVVAERISAAVVDWSRAAATPPFTARIRGALRVSHDGPVKLVLASDQPATLDVDAERILSAPGQPEERVLLARGNHAVDLEVRVSKRSGITALRWQRGGAAEEELPRSALFSPSLATGGLLGSYYRGSEGRGAPVFRQVDPQLAYYFHFLPVERPFSVRWLGSLFVPAPGEYELGTVSIDESTVRVDGRTIVVNHRAGSYEGGKATLDAGWHPVEVEYRNENNYAQVYLYWTPPGEERSLVPAERLRPLGPRAAAGSAGPG